MNGIAAAPTPRHAQFGLSLVELMIALVISLIIVAGVIQIYLFNRQSYAAQEQLALMQEGGRFAMELITRDLRRAGYWGGAVELSRIERGNPGHEAPLHSCDPTEDKWGRMIRWRVSGVNRGNTGYEDCAVGYLANSDTDILTVRYADTVTAQTLAANGLYLRENTDSGAILTGLTASLDPTDDVPPPDGDVVEIVDRALISHAYYVADSGRACPNGDIIPELRRIRLDPTSGHPTWESIASGVEQLQVRYLLDGQYQDADATWSDEWLRISAVRVWLLMRGECREQDLESNIVYDMADLGAYPDPANDRFRRQLYVSTVMLRNTLVGD